VKNIRIDSAALDELEDRLLEEVDRDLIDQIENRRFSKMKKKLKKKHEEIEEN